MTTIKSYIDIEQSKALAKILPIESADMCYCAIHNIGQETHYCNIPIFAHIANGDIPCWSLAALLDILPKGTRLLKSATDDIYHCDCPKCNIDEWFDNPVDACYEIILKLHEFKIL